MKIVNERSNMKDTRYKKQLEIYNYQDTRYKQDTITNVQITNVCILKFVIWSFFVSCFLYLVPFPIKKSVFEFRISDLFRISSFEFRIWPGVSPIRCTHSALRSLSESAAPMPRPRDIFIGAGGCLRLYHG